jgi:hypothetical protein
MLKSNKKALGVIAQALAVVASLVASSGSARAEETEKRTIGVGYKLGNGIGFAGGDLIVRAFSHVSFDLQASYPAGYSFEGLSVAPAVQVQLKPTGHTPYLDVGFVYMRFSTDQVHGYAAGVVANAGYEWRFASGVGILVGGGVQDHGPVHLASGTASAESGSSGPSFNLEAGLRYFF